VGAVNLLWTLLVFNASLRDFPWLFSRRVIEVYSLFERLILLGETVWAGVVDL
jgi:hypothetical protein